MKASQLDLFATARDAGKIATAPRHCRSCGICDPLPTGVTWAAGNRCSDCAVDAAPKIALAAYQTEPCPVKGCTGWRHPLATMCDGCKTLIPRELHLQLMRASIAERDPRVEARHGPFDRPALKAAAIKSAEAAREARR